MPRDIGNDPSPLAGEGGSRRLTDEGYEARMTWMDQALDQ